MRHTALVVVLSALIGAVVGAAVALIIDSDGGRSAEETNAVITAAVESEVERALIESDARGSAELASLLNESLSSQERRIAEVFAQVEPSVVVIDAESPERRNEEGVLIVPAALATGFALDGDGHIVTAAHVIEGMTSFTIILASGDRWPAERVGDDRPFSDVAVLRIRSDEALADLVVPSFGQTVGIETGEPVLAIGNTLLGAEIAVTAGIVSDPDTTFFRERYEQDHLIQTDAALNHGNSGGVLVDLDGDIIGMTAVIARETQDGNFVDGVGFAIQIDAVLEVARGIAADGFYPRPTFGVVDERLLTPTAAAQLDLEVTQGSFLIELERGGAFARAGIRPGDVLRGLNDIVINADMPYLNALATLRPEEPVIVHIHRGGEEYRLSIAPDLRAP